MPVKQERANPTLGITPGEDNKVHNTRSDPVIGFKHEYGSEDNGHPDGGADEDEDKDNGDDEVEEENEEGCNTIRARELQEAEQKCKHP